MTYKAAAEIIKKAKKVAIFGHSDPDFDAFGSCFSLKEGLKQLKIKADIFFDGQIGARDENIFNSKKVLENFNPKKYDLVVILDCRDFQRLGKYCDDVKFHKNVLKIDHHQENDVNLIKNKIVNTKASSTSEMVYNLLINLGVKINASIANYIYAGISSDTNSFLNDNTTEDSLKIASIMLKNGANNILINGNLFKNISKQRWELQKLAYEKAEMHQNYAILIIRKKDLASLKIDNEDKISEFSTKFSYIDGILIGCSLLEINLNTYKCSLRSKLGVDVSKIAEFFGGGGHKQAAGFSISGKYGEVYKKVKKVIEDSLKEQGF